MRFSTVFGATVASFVLPSVLAGSHTFQARHHHDIAKRVAGDVVEKRGGVFDNARLTFYDVGLGACGKTNVPSDFIVALNSAQFGSGYPGPHCFEMIKITYKGRTTQAQIMDECPGCPYGGLDLSRGLFDFFASEDIGVLSATWEFANGGGGGGSPPPPPPPPPKTSKPPPPPPPSSTKKANPPKTSSPPPPPPPPKTSVPPPPSSTHTSELHTTSEPHTDPAPPTSHTTHTTTSTSHTPPPSPSSSSTHTPTSSTHTTTSRTTTSHTTTSHTSSKPTTTHTSASSAAPLATFSLPHLGDPALASYVPNYVVPTGQPENLADANQALISFAEIIVAGGSV